MLPCILLGFSLCKFDRAVSEADYQETLNLQGSLCKASLINDSNDRLLKQAKKHSFSFLPGIANLNTMFDN